KIQGTGTIGNGGLAVINGAAGIINANAAGATLLVNSSGGLTNQGLLESTGTGTLQLSTPVNNSGEIVPDGSPNPGTISISSNLTQTSSGAEGVFIGGLTAGTQYSQLNVSGTANLSGALDIGFINGFTPASGNQFTVLTAGSITGTFSSINSAALPAGVIWTLTYNPTSVVLTAASGTSTSQTLTITELGTGSGSVTDNLGQINCVDTGGAVTGTCSASYLTGTNLILTANPSTGTTFNGWSTCPGTGACSVTMNTSQSVTATFNPSGETTFALTLKELGTGAGTVTDNSSPTPLINCSEAGGSVTPGSTCSASYASGTPVTLTAAATSPSTFAGWGGECSGTSTTCTVTMNSAQNVTANFVTPPTPVTFTIPVGTNVTAMATYACPDNPNPTPANPCTDPNGYAVQLTIPQVTSSFSLSVVATEFQADGLCPPGGNGQSSDSDCRFADFFNYGTDPNGNTVVPLCWPYANGNCVHYDVYSGTPGTEPPTGSYSGPLYWQVSFNNGSFVPGAYWTGSTARVLDNPDVNEFPGVPYGTNCSTAMEIGTPPTQYSPTVYCQFDQDITTFFSPIEGVDATIGGKTPQANDVVVAFLPTSTGTEPVQTPPSKSAPAIAGSCVNGCVPIGSVSNNATITFTEGTGGTFAVTATGYPTPTLTGSGTLPVGLTFNPTTGLVSGTPADGTFGNYPITFTAANGVLPNATLSYTLTVNPAGTLTITASSPSMTYGGTVPAITASYSGFVNGDSSASLTTQPTCSITGNPTKVGTYTTTCSGAADANYSAISYVNGTLTVNPAALTITASSPTITYGTTPVITPIYSGFVNGDSASSLTTQPTCSTTATSTSPPGTYPSSCSGAADANYTITYVSGTVTVTATASALEISPASVNFGTLYLWQIAAQFVTLTNEGTTPITISSIKITAPGNALGDYGDISSCAPFISAMPDKLPAGKSCTIAVGLLAAMKIFSPTASTATLTITDSAAGSPHQVPLTAQVIDPQATLSTYSLNFGTQKEHTSSTKTVKLTNTGLTPLSLSSIAISGNFTLSSGTTCASGMMNPSASCILNVTFAPESKGSFRGKVTITDNAFFSPQVITLAGTGD
ncbi:MAG: MBG domain-containing protein, partial [Terriglobales bacterium]